jgi:phosphoglycerate dehydrogenase-like enzyme
MRPRVLVDRHRWTRAEDWGRLAQSVELVELKAEATCSEEELIAALRGCQGLIKLGRRVPDLTRRVFEGAPDLKIVGLASDRFGTGIDLEAAGAHGVTVVDADNAGSAQPVAEWVLALILLCLRNAGAVYRQMVAGTETWARTGNEAFVNGELTGRKVGLLGCGHVGQRLIELLVPFRVDLRVYDPYLPNDRAAALGILREELEGVLRHAEILVVQVPLTPRTAKLIGTRELELLGTGSILINCSRGRVVDQQALIRKLEARELIAGLDVFDPEPLERDSPLRSLPNVFITPHIAWYAPNALHRCFAHTVQEFERFFNGEPLQYELTRRMVDIRHGRI